MITHQRNRLFLSTAAMAMLAAGPAQAATTVDSDSKVALKTSTAGDVTIADDAELKVTGADPVTIDSNSTVTVEEDAIIQSDAANGRAGIRVNSTSGFSIDNVGTIYVTEDFVPADEDSNSIADGAIAKASSRAGIEVNGPSGSIDNSGTIYVEGLNSYGVVFNSDFSGTFDNTGQITVLGDNSVGLQTKNFDGDLTVGAVTAIGDGARAVVVDGDVSGTLIFSDTVARSRTFTNDDDETVYLSRGDLRTYAPTATVSGNVAGGILVDNRPYELDSSNSDEDGDGITDGEETVGAISAIGESPALLIGSVEDITIGSVEGRDGTYSLAVDGTISGSGTYSSFNVNTVVIGGQGGAVDMSDGIGVSGSVSAATVDSYATAILINEGAYVPRLENSGTISATISSTGEGHAITILDNSGTLASVTNTGFITASGSMEDYRVALDLQSNSSGVTILQQLNSIDADAKAEEMEDEDYDPSSPTYYTGIKGNILTGSGNDTLDIQSGYIYGDAYLGTGDDSVTLSDDSYYLGDIHSGTGTFVMGMQDSSRFVGTLDVAGENALLTLSDSSKFTGTVENGENLTINVDGGVLISEEGAITSFDTLNVGADGAIGIAVGDDSDTGSGFVVNQASFASGSRVNASINSIAGAEGTYSVLEAGSITGSPNVTLETGDLPVLFAGSLDVTNTSIALEVRRKPTEELGLTGPQSAAYDAIIALTGEDSYVEASLLQVEDEAGLKEQFDGLLPDYAGGTFDFVTRASRIASRHISDDGAQFAISPIGAWVEGLYFNGSKDYTDSAGFTNNGKGVAGGMERDFGFGYLGLSLSYMGGNVTNGDLQTIDASSLEIAGHWRKKIGGLYTFARASYIKASFDSSRIYTGVIDDEEFTYTSTTDWGGRGFTGMAGASYNIPLTSQFTLRPKAVFDYFHFKEDGSEEDTDLATDLIVEGRTSKALTATTSAVASYSFGRRTEDYIPLTIEVEGGWRSVLDGAVGDTVASFVDGESFTLTPDALKGGWTTEARILSGGLDFQWQIGLGAEKTQGDVDLTARIGLSAAF